MLFRSNVLRNDTDPESDPLSVTDFTIDGVTYNAGQTATITGVGTLVINSDGSYTFTPVPGFTGTVPPVTYTADDGNGLTDTGTLTFTIVPNPVPIANDDPVTVTEDQPATGNLLTNDVDSGSVAKKFDLGGNYMTNALAFPLPAAVGSLESYVQSVNRFPILSAEEEIRLAKKLREEGDLEAARQLVLSHLRLVVAVARGYLGYGLPHGDLIQEGNIGLMKAVKRFDPDRGVRLVSFAIHWIKAEKIGRAHV